MSPDSANANRINTITERVIGCAFIVSRTLGRGYLEKVYENALAHECRKAGLHIEQQRRLVVMYDGVDVGEYVADMVIEDLVLVEIKAVKCIDPAHVVQCINYLTSTRLPVCLLLNFATKVEVRRLVGPFAPIFPPSLESLTASAVPMTQSEEVDYEDRP
ncbi:MAG: GxxExxY protein [Phycisphaerales bacterium]|nr:GxxExxY protein [Phycisphaerales bacterium]